MQRAIYRKWLQSSNETWQKIGTYTPSLPIAIAANVDLSVMPSTGATSSLVMVCSDPENSHVVIFPSVSDASLTNLEPTILTFHQIIAAIHCADFCVILESAATYGEGSHSGPLTMALHALTLRNDVSERRWVRGGIEHYGTPLVLIVGESIAVWRCTARSPQDEVLAEDTVTAGVIQFWTFENGQLQEMKIETRDRDLIGIASTDHCLVGWSEGRIDTWNLEGGVHLHSVSVDGLDGGMKDQIQVCADGHFVALWMGEGRLGLVDVLKRTFIGYRIDVQDTWYGFSDLYWVVFMDQQDGIDDTEGGQYRGPVDHSVAYLAWEAAK